MDRSDRWGLEALGRLIGLRPHRRTGGRGSADGQLIYAVGDVHGCYGLLKALLAQIAADYPQRARGRRPLLVFCGDYVDRGPQPAEVLEALIWLQRHGPYDLHLLKGNHEQALLAFLETPADGGAWLRYGGAETLAGYDVVPPAPDAGAAEFVRARDELLARLPPAHLSLLQSLSLMVTVGDYAFVHAGVRPGTALADQMEDDLLWIREDFIRAQGPFEKIIVHGHSWTSDRPQILPHRVGIDTGAYATGVLSAVRIEDGGLTALRADTASDVAWNPWSIPAPPARSKAPIATPPAPGRALRLRRSSQVAATPAAR